MEPKNNISGKAQDRVHLCLQYGDVVGAVRCGSDIYNIIFLLLAPLVESDSVYQPVFDVIFWILNSPKEKSVFFWCVCVCFSCY